VDIETLRLDYLQTVYFVSTAEIPHTTVGEFYDVTVLTALSLLYKRWRRQL